MPVVSFRDRSTVWTTQRARQKEKRGPVGTTLRATGSEAHASTSPGFAAGVATARMLSVFGWVRMPLQDGHWPRPHVVSTGLLDRGQGPRSADYTRGCEECKSRISPSRGTVPVIVFPLAFSLQIQYQGCVPSGAAWSWRRGAEGARTCRCLDPVSEGAEELELPNGAALESLAPGKEFNLAPPGRGQFLEEVVELGDKDGVGDAGEEGRYEGLEGEEGLDGILAAVMDGPGGEVEVVGELIGRAEDGVDELVEVVPSEGVGVMAGAEGVEVVAWGASAAGPEFGVAVGAAVGVVAHGPVAATGDLAAGLVWISGHGC
jgi:hypothetical protein